MINLSVMLSCRYERTGRLGDLEDAIQIAEEAVKGTPEEHPNLAIYLYNQGDILLKLYMRNGRPEILEMPYTRQNVP